MRRMATGMDGKDSVCNSYGGFCNFVCRSSLIFHGKLAHLKNEAG